jgi:hypothetical protein
VILSQTSAPSLDEVRDFDDLHLRLQSWRGTLDKTRATGRVASYG